MRACGSCTLCCTLVPVKELQKGSFTRCQFERAVPHLNPGCAIYATRPSGCRQWRCVWLNSPNVPDEMRPDRVGFVVDERPDLVEVNGKENAAVQVWVEPGHEDDWREDGPAQRMIRTLLQVAPVVLWRQTGGMARSFLLRDGVIVWTEPRGYVGDNHLGDERERWRKLQRLMETQR